MKLAFDGFESWIRNRASGCMEQHEIDLMCEGDMDSDSGEYTFRDTGVQGQWEAWQGLCESRSRSIVHDESSNLTEHDWSQIEMAARGCVSGTSDEWPELRVAIMKASRNRDVFWIRRPASWLHGFCLGVLSQR